MSGYRLTADQKREAEALRQRLTARPAAGDTRTDRERLREVIARTILEAQPWCESWDVLSDGPGTLREEFRGYADAVLALPELAALLDAADTRP